MTTEVLRNMLYAGSTTLQGLGYVVMDEVHYLADRFRGPVWEEVIIHLTDDVQLVSLSATVSNAEEFGDWLATVRGDTTVVVSEHRPVPLGQHVLVHGELLDLYAGHVDPTAPGVDPPINPDLTHLLRRSNREEIGQPRRGPRDRGGRPRPGGGRPGGGRPTPRFAVVDAPRPRRAAAGDRLHLLPGRVPGRGAAVPGRRGPADHARRRSPRSAGSWRSAARPCRPRTSTCSATGSSATPCSRAAGHGAAGAEPGASPARCSAPSGRRRPSSSRSSQGHARRPATTIGQWGLEAALPGAARRRPPTRRSSSAIARRRAEQDAAARPGQPGRTLRTTLDRDVQRAAEQALGDRRRRKAALVAVQPSTGDILAVANRPTDSTYDRALDGRYPPGSTFKVVTTAALLRDGLNDERHRRLPADDHRRRQAVQELRGRRRRRRAVRARDFAQSCNTAFVSLARRLPADALPTHGARLRPRPQAHLARPTPGPRRRRRRRPRGDDDRPGPDRRQPAGHGRRRRDRRRRALARAAPARRRPARRTGPALADGERATLRDADARRRHLRHRHGARRRCPATSRARAAPPSTAAATRRPRTRGSSPSAATSPSPCWSRTGRSGGSVAAPIAKAFFDALGPTP